MIIFYDKDSGKIIGNVDGRVHGEEHLKMWIGENTDRVVCQWEKDPSGRHIPSVQKEVFSLLDSGEKSIWDYKVNTETKELEPIE